MWSSEPSGMRLLALAAVAALAGCVVTPVYGPTPRASTVGAELSSIAIQPSDDRVEQRVRNALIFDFGGGAGETVTPLYDLALHTTLRTTALGVTPVQTSPSYSIHVTVSYELTEILSGTIVTRGVARGVATYDRSNQEFANVRAAREAEDRAAAAAADEIRIRIAAALASGA